MFFIILGIVIVLVGIIISRQPHPSARFGSIVNIIGIVAIVLGALTSMFKVIDAGQVGVKTIFGKVDNDVLYSGLNIINPVADVTTFDVKTQNYTMSGVHDEGERQGDDAIRYYHKNQIIFD